MVAIAILGDGLLARSIFDALAPIEQAIGEPPQFVMLGHADFDVQDYGSIAAALKPHKPAVVINTVALHALARCEADPSLAFDINAKGAERVSSLARTVYISTDYVFSDGGPHDESMPGRQPRSVYGRSKLAGELATLEHDGIVVRVAGLYGHHLSHKGPTFPESMLASWDTVQLPTDQVFSPTYAPDAAWRIAQLALASEASGIYHAANDGSTSWAAFGEDIVSLARHRRHIKPIVQRDHLRPANSALRSTRLKPLRHWLLALDAWWMRRQELLYENRTVSPLRSG